MDKACLVIIFNHKYNKNISTLESIYKEKFEKIFYIIPFNKDRVIGVDEERIISVYETSYCFQGYIAQAYDRLKETKCSHFVFIGDDQLLNPKFNDSNIITELGLKEDESYIKEIIPYDEICNGSLKDQSNKLYNILCAFRINVGVSYRSEIPSYECACQKCEKMGLRVAKKLPFKFFVNKGYLGIKYLPLTIVTIGINKGFKLPYPLFKAYSDMFIIDQKSMEEFCRLSGVFAAMNIFVETAIPLAMVLACNKVKTEKNLNGYRGVEYWNEDIALFEKKYNLKLGELLDDFGKDIIYYHPIKLSKWK